MLRLFALSHVKSTAPKLCAAALPYFKFNRSYAQPNAFDDDDIDAEFFDDDLDFLDELFDENLEDVFADFSGDVSQ
ncbi:hypothetical protein ADEAN_000461200 [Angomonas deanei]|uniref:Uncharacterized protein n=1 Tax=Angomonas deanei TaxID=59799 RepID=A0A7G2CE34_9TRYP|nr:hypothetical protein ADEAN_000461200 [Angomonas deanei]